MNREELLQSEVNKIGITLSSEQVKQFMDYYSLLIEWNSFMNLTAITDFNDVIIKHFVDSLSLVKALNLTKNYSLIDVGTGAGFPGVPLKIAFPQLRVTLLDSLQKRIKFLDELIIKINLHDIETIHGRAEELAKPGKLREKYDICVSRAVANLNILSEYCLPFVKFDGCFISYKSEKLSEELEQSKNTILVLGGKLEKQIDFKLNNDIYRNLIIIRKVKNTPTKYPRKSSIISKKSIS